MKKAAILISILSFVFIGCNRLHITTLTMDGAIIYQEALKLSGAYGVFVVAKADIDFYDRNALPQISPPPPDSESNFPKITLPSFLTPESGAQVNVNGTVLNEAYEGQYQGSIQDIHPGDSVSVNVSTQNGDTGKAELVMPGEFTLNLHDTTIIYDSLNTLDFTWSKSSNANAYMVLLYSVDTTTNSVSLNMKKITEDTTYSISKDEVSPGIYLLQVAAIYGRIDASMPQAGTLVGVIGQVATLYVKKPVNIFIR